MDNKIEHDQIRDEVLKLVCYADLFDYSPSLNEITADLPWACIEASHVRNSILNSENHSPILISHENHLFLKGRENLQLLGIERRENTQELIKKYGKYLSSIANLPYVRSIALSGAAAFDNSSQNDDIDLFIIVQPNRLWIVELYNLFVIRFWREKVLGQPRTICSNYIIETVSLALPERDFFTAHQIVHMKPIYDEGYWHYFIKANSWINNYFPSYKSANLPEFKKQSTKRILEILGDFAGIGILNFVLFALRGKRLNHKRRLGIVKGLYSFRRLKANDSRRSAIVMRRLEGRISDYFPQKNENPDFLKNQHFAQNDGIRDFMNFEENARIAKFMDFYISRNSENLKKSEILEIPYFSKNRKNQNLWKRRSMNFTRVKALIRELEPDNEGPVLDLGAGNCWLSRRLIDNGYRMISVDACIDEKIGLKAGDIFEGDLKIPLERYRAMMDRLPFKDESFKGIVASGSFHYGENPEKILKEIYRILAPGGWAIIYDSPVFMYDFDGLAMVTANRKKYDPSNELDGFEYKPRWFINRNEFTGLAKSIGFECQIIETRDYFRRCGDIIKNAIMSKRRWSEFPILLLRKIDAKEHSKQAGIIQRIRYFHYRFFVEGTLDSDRTYSIQGIKLKVSPGVFHPMPYDSSRILLSALRKRYASLQGRYVLDMGTGSGIHAIAASMLGAKVLAVDINPESLATASENAKLNGAGESIRFTRSDLFDNAGDEKFDLVLFNPPFYEGLPQDISEKAWKDKDSDTLTGFIKELPHHLKTDGEALIILSNRMDVGSFKSSCSSAGLKVSEVSSKRVWDEAYHVYSLKLKNLR